MQTMPSPERPRWAPRVRQDRIRALYRSEAASRLDEELLLDLGWALWARARDVATVSEAVISGWVTCPNCGERARRLRRERIVDRAAIVSHSSCRHCGRAWGWSEMKEALMLSPRCLGCGQPLAWRYEGSELSCSACGESWEFATYRRLAHGRKRLPCPACGAPVARVRGDVEADTEEAEIDEAKCHGCGAVHSLPALRQAWREALPCPCGGRLCTRGREVVCTTCGATVPRRRISERLARRRTGPCPTCGERMSLPRDTVRCRHCGWQGPWSGFRRTWQGERLLTGAGVGACRRFTSRWPACRDAASQMILVDGLLHQLHCLGPLAPLLVEGTAQSVAALLDEIGGVRRLLQPDAP